MTQPPYPPQPQPPYSYSFPPPPPPPPPPPNPYAEANGKKLAAGLCAILVGSFGIHKFILGYNTAGLIMLLATVLTCGIAGIAMHIISIVEGVMYLTKSDAEFYSTYMAGRKEWF